MQPGPQLAVNTIAVVEIESGLSHIREPIAEEF
jgi:hypothetical protein